MFLSTLTSVLRATTERIMIRLSVLSLLPLMISDYPLHGYHLVKRVQLPSVVLVLIFLTADECFAN